LQVGEDFSFSPPRYLDVIYLFILFVVSPGSVGLFSISFLFQRIKENVEKEKRKKKKKAPRVPQDGQNRSELPVTSADLIPSSGRTFHVTQLRVFVSGTKDVSPLSLSILLVRFNPPFSLLLSRSS